MNIKKSFVIMVLFICQLSRAESTEYIELAIQKSQLETVKVLLANSKLSKLEKGHLAKQAHLEAMKRKAKIDTNSSTKGLKRIIFGYIYTIAGVTNALCGYTVRSCVNLAIGISLYKWGTNSRKQDLINKIISKKQKHENALLIEELLKKENSSDSAKQDQQ